MNIYQNYVNYQTSSFITYIGKHVLTTEFSTAVTIKRTYYYKGTTWQRQVYFFKILEKISIFFNQLAWHYSLVRHTVGETPSIIRVIISNICHHFSDHISIDKWNIKVNYCYKWVQDIVRSMLPDKYLFLTLQILQRFLSI